MIKDERISDTDWALLTKAEYYVNSYTKLASAEACRIALNIYSRSPRVEASRAKEITNMILGSYPYKKLNPDENYLLAISSVFERYPEFVCAEAADQITLTSKYLPTRAAVYEACEKCAVKYRAIGNVAEKHLKEHSARQVTAKRERERKISLAVNNDKK